MEPPDHLFIFIILYYLFLFYLNVIYYIFSIVHIFITYFLYLHPLYYLFLSLHISLSISHFPFPFLTLFPPSNLFLSFEHRAHPKKIHSVDIKEEIDRPAGDFLAQFNWIRLAIAKPQADQILTNTLECNISVQSYKFRQVVRF
jgi:hypothetical protein